MELLDSGRYSEGFHEIFVRNLANRKSKDDKIKRKERSNKVTLDGESLSWIEIAPNASKFAVYNAIRSIVLEVETKNSRNNGSGGATGKLAKSFCYHQSSGNDNEQNCLSCKEKSKDPGSTKEIDVSDFDFEENFEVEEPQTFNVSKIVGAGLESLFEIISETRNEHPRICTKALKSLYDIIQGQDPESFRNEPDKLFNSLYDILLELATMHSQSPVNVSLHQKDTSWSSISCSTLLALCTAKGDTGKLLKAVTSILMSPKILSGQLIQLPQSIIKLQRSVQSVALGKCNIPDYYTYGISQNSLIDYFTIKDYMFVEKVFTPNCIASDGKYLYILISKSLIKIGSGFNGTVPGFIYGIAKDFGKDRNEWIGYCNNKLFYKKLSKRNMDTLLVVDTETLQITGSIQTQTTVSMKDGNNCLLFTDGESICCICTSSGSDNLLVKQLYSRNSFAFDLNLKLAKDGFYTLGYSTFEEEILSENQLKKIQTTNNSFNPMLPNEINLSGISCGKEFGLVLGSNGKVFYYGKGNSLGLKAGGKNPNLKLNEIVISKASNFVQVAVGHDGIHALLLNEDGTVFFAGTTRRGEDGEQSKNRRQLKAVKPKKVSKMDGYFVTNISCNNGTSAFVTKDGKLIMFGKDTNYCDSAGIVTGLNDVQIVKVALGKAHCVALDSKGQLYTFGLNNKGQCGRKFIKDRNDDTFDPKPKQPTFKPMCPIDEHNIVDGKCRICNVCRECTGYNTACVSTKKTFVNERIPGTPCSCGHGSAGCSKCGSCSVCVASQESGTPPFENNTDTQSVAEKAKDAINRKYDSLRLGEEGSQFSDTDTPRIVPVAPQRVELPTKSPIVQISCGLHHTVVLTLAGEVFTFGSNQYGQLGSGDLQPISGAHLVKIPYMVSQVAAGSNHTVILTTKGIVYSFGNFQKGQLGRLPGETNLTTGSDSYGNSSGNLSTRFDQSSDKMSVNDILLQRQKFLWNCSPGAVNGIGPSTGKKASWIGASGDQTFIKIDESLVNASMLSKFSVVADKNTILLIPNNQYPLNCIAINRRNGNCKAHNRNQFDFKTLMEKMDEKEYLNCRKRVRPVQPQPHPHHSAEGILENQENHFLSDLDLCYDSKYAIDVSGRQTHVSFAFAMDPCFNVLWGFDSVSKSMMFFNVIASGISPNSEHAKDLVAILTPEIALPSQADAEVTRYQASLNILASLDILTTNQRYLKKCFLPSDAGHKMNIDGKDNCEYNTVCRFDSFGGGWGYSSYSVEAIRFMCDTDVIVAGFGMYGGRGEYTCKLKLFDLGYDGGNNEKDGVLISEVDDIPFECPSKCKYNITLPSPLTITAERWYLVQAKISGPSSDCGSSGQSTISTSDNVVFHFKTSKKANNGTNVSSGQIPSILYKVISQSSKAVFPSITNEPVCKLSKKFANTLTKDCFESLVMQLNWAWSSFKVSTTDLLETRKPNQNTISLNRLVYICKACLRLLRKYINDIYPYKGFGNSEKQPNKVKPSNARPDPKSDKSPKAKPYDNNGLVSSADSKSDMLKVNEINIMEINTPMSNKKNATESIQLAECIGDVRALLTQILCDELPYQCGNDICSMILDVLDECHTTFVSCFNAFYPTSFLKWSCICNLLAQIDKGILHSRLLSGVLAGLCDPNINLRSTFSMLSPNVEYKSLTSPSDNLGFPMLLSTENYQYPILVEQMLYRTQKEKTIGCNTWTFKDVLSRLLDIISKPIRLKIENIYNNQSADIYNGDAMKRRLNNNLITNSCRLLSKMLAEIIYQNCTIDTETAIVPSNVLHSSGNRFAKVDVSKTWNTGNFGPDAIAFTVDRPGISIAGACVYSGSGSYEYQLELLYDSMESKSQLQHKWEVIESVVGAYDQSMVKNLMTEIKFDRAISIKENVRYALRLCSQGARTCSGDGGFAAIRGPCGVTFKFYPCDLSFNGTTPARGQIPCVLYYSIPSINESHSGKYSKESHARDIALQISTDITSRCKDLLIHARNAVAFSSSSSDKSSNSSHNTHTVDSEHNITPIEEHLDIAWINNSDIANVNNVTSSSFDHNSSTAKDITKRIESFSKGIIETLKFDKKSRNSIDFDIEIDIGAEEITPNDYIDDRNNKLDSISNGNTSGLGMQSKADNFSIMNDAGSDVDEFNHQLNQERIIQLFSAEDSCLFTMLLPLTFAHIGPLVCSNLKSSVEVLGLIRAILPHVSALNQINNFKLYDLVKHDMSEKLRKSTSTEQNDLCTTSHYYCIVESDHPYKSSTVANYRIEFPPSVRWMTIEFDPQCGTVQPEDIVFLKIPRNPDVYKMDHAFVNDNCTPKPNTRKSKEVKLDSNVKPINTIREEQSEIDWINVKKFNTPQNWCNNSIVLPGNKLEISLETASMYVREQKGNKYGFKGLIIGYDNRNLTKYPSTSLIHLEYELSYLGGLCSANLLKKDLIFSDDVTENIANTEETLKKHIPLLSKGLMVSDSVLTINNALESNLPITEQSYEKQFLKDFIYVAAGSPGARLAAWLQPESRLDPNKCEIKMSQEPLRCGWPSHFIIETRDQYGDEIFVPGIKIEVKACLGSNLISESNRKLHMKSRNDSLYLGGAALPPKISYECTFKEKEKSCLKAITAMKPYQPYSFEELRYCNTIQNKTTEVLTANDLGNNTYGVFWTPSVPGNYSLTITIDGVSVEEIYRVDVIDAGLPPLSQETTLKKVQPPTKLRKFIAKNSAGLRVRLHPTLQSDQIGIVKLNGIVSYIDEMENDDGLWVRLSTESIREHCTSSWFPTEAWCLQYNQHLGKTLLHPILESSSTKALMEQVDQSSPTTSDANEENENTIDYFDFMKTDRPTDEASSTNDEEPSVDKLLQITDATDDIPLNASNINISNINQSNIGAAIAGVVGGGAKKMQALQKWLKGDSFDENDMPKKRRSEGGTELRSNGNRSFDRSRSVSPEIISLRRCDSSSSTKSDTSKNNMQSKGAEKSDSSMDDRRSAENLAVPEENFSPGIPFSNKSLKIESNELPKRALSPSIAETLRAVFSAFLWHEGLVHDAMACASFLKFHPSISKKESENMPVGNPHEHLLTREQKVLQRHSVEISNAGTYLNIRPSTLETLAKIGNCCIHNRKLRNRNAEIFSSKDGEYPQPSALPPALRCLVYVWDQLCCNFIHLVETNSNDKENDFSLKSNKSSEEKSSNNTKNQSQKKVEDGCWCELCDVFLPIPVTYHMRIVHPGCGKYAKGKGYNSIGVYCEGWAGNCGDGGQGVSSWYLMCEKCRQKYVNSAKVSNNVNYNCANRAGAKEGGTNILMGFSAESTIPSELFTIMKENSFFLLELNSYNGGLINKSNTTEGAGIQEQPNNSRFRNADLNDSYNSSYYFEEKNTNWTGTARVNSYRHLYDTSSELMWPPPELLSCIEALGAKTNNDLTYNLLGMNMTDMHAYDFKTIEDISMDADSYVKNIQTSPAVASTSKFHRSFSMGQGWNTPQNKLINEYNPQNKLENGTKNEGTSNVVLRRKKQCTCTSGDSNLLNYPSINLQNLVPEHLLSNNFSKESTPNNRSKNKMNSKINDKNNIQTNPRAALMANGKRPEEINFSEFLEMYHNNARENGEKVKNADDKSDGSGSITSNSYKLDVQAGALSLLNRPSMIFMLEKHDLKKLRHLMTRNLRKTVCNIYSLQALNWLLRSVTQPIGLHDIMWWFISSLSYSTHDNEDEPKLDEGVLGLEHPGSNQFNGPLSQTLSQSLHALLQTVADLTLLLPSGSSLQKTAVQCFGLKFKQSDHQFLHRSHVFGNISKILSKSEEQNEENLVPSIAMLNSYSNALIAHPEESIRIDLLNDITEVFDLVVSSRPAMANSLIDNSTETFWESDEEDRNKPKVIELTMNRTNYHCKIICVHIDNSRDIGSKVSSILIYGGSSFGETSLMKTIEVDPLACRWISAPISDDECTHYRLDFRGPEATLRVRQIKLLGYTAEDKAAQFKHNLKVTSASLIQQKNCEAETLRVFRLLTGQVFGKLILESGNYGGANALSSSKINESAVVSSSTESLDLREHMVGILFSRSKLSHLQKQIIVHIVHAIQKEAVRSREEWEHNVMFSADNETDFEENLKLNDTYCFEMLSMVLALSGSAVGRSYLSHQHGLLKDLFSLLHTGSDRVQRQVTALIRRILPEISPEILCELIGVDKVPETDFNLLSQNNETFNMNKCGILDIFLAVIAKALQVQIKVKNNSNKSPPTMKLWRYMNICKIDDYEKSTLNKLSMTNSQFSNVDSDRQQMNAKESPIAEPYDLEASSSEFLDDKTNDDNSVDFDACRPKSCTRADMTIKPRWYLNGTISSKQAENIMVLIRDMAHGKLSEKWSLITKAAIAECILNITRLSDIYRVPETCMTTPTLWLALASLCVLDRDHVEKLSSSQWSKQSESRPLCSNHDDDVTYAMIICSLCGTLCSDCDRFLHLNRKTRNHYRTVCKEEEEAIRVELHESCGRAKLFWLLALVDSKTLKGMLEFRNGNNTLVCDPPNAIGVCRFCGITGTTGLLAVGNVCVDQQCQEHAASACTKIHPCGHLCGGIISEEKCLPCLQQKCLTTENKLNNDKEPKLTQDADDMCMICFTEALSSAPSIQLECGHVFHFHCCKAVLTRRWNGPRISFGFSQCPICKMDIQHKALADILEPIVALKTDVKRKALMRLDYEGFAKNLESKDLAAHAMERYAYYVCSQCEKAYYGGEARCDAELGENFDPQELVCGGCSDVVKAKMCPKHGTDFLEYKCRYCCSVAVFFCFGTTHFCDTCHDDFQRLTNIPKNKLPKCPAGPKAKQLIGEECPLHVIHPATGEEFALGCGICRNAHTF
ncbi:E3 ubiquitin-protein ligase highwire isoform X2 [Toxorhynchites rutilus septentrionalis]|uniref:E3 ubiquitin-protein ligase highwire isoform X2 n=1 Tax=Toxorhynchites rutilus septentrionalis TaxID=329112 RepID=UPI002479DD71|nr:E3 ubiquitin-protein ligase highwire isoform X2 [Toxorhynchites rutilus septentrionalis]